MGIQTLQAPNGDEMVVMSMRDYLELRVRAGDEDAEDLLDDLLARDARNEPSLSEEASRAVLEGISLAKAQTAAE